MEELGDKTLTLKYLICELPSGVLMVEGYETRICLDVSDLKAFRAVSIPDDIMAILGEARDQDPGTGDT